MLNLLNRIDGGIGTNMRKAAHPSGGMDSSNPHRWRGEQLHHHGDGVCLLFVLFCAVSSDRRHSSYVDKYESNLKVGLLMKQSAPPRLAPYLQSSRVKGVIRKTEVTRVAIAEVGWQTVHEFCDGSVKLVLKKVSKSCSRMSGRGYRSWNFDPPLCEAL